MNIDNLQTLFANHSAGREVLEDSMRTHVSKRLSSCHDCGFCRTYIFCRGTASCIGCGACVAACPFEARVLEHDGKQRKMIRVKVDGESADVLECITVLDALESLGYVVSRFPREGDVFAPCRLGGCWACAVIIDGELKPSCTTAVRDNMNIQTAKHEVAKHTPLRLVSGFEGHSVGGVGTPYWIKPKGWNYRYIEVACFAHGCILRCPTCQNWEITYSSVEEPLTPNQAARMMTRQRRGYGVDRMAISGGECTLNRRWLIEYLKELRRLNTDEEARFHVDTNAVILAPDYIDDLVQAGMTDIGPDVKGLDLDTFLRISRVNDEDLARKLLETEWNAVKYLLDQYWGEIFIGIGVPYNPKLISLEEVQRIGERIADMETDVQVCVLDYRPEFRRQDIARPTFDEMVQVKDVLEGAGLRCVICQTERGHIGP